MIPRVPDLRNYNTITTFCRVIVFNDEPLPPAVSQAGGSATTGNNTMTCALASATFPLKHSRESFLLLGAGSAAPPAAASQHTCLRATADTQQPHVPPVCVCVRVLTCVAAAPAAVFFLPLAARPGGILAVCLCHANRKDLGPACGANKETNGALCSCTHAGELQTRMFCSVDGNQMY